MENAAVKTVLCKVHPAVGLARIKLCMKRNQVISGVVVLVVVAGGSFYAGSAYAKSQTPARGQFATTFQGGAGGAGFNRLGRAVGAGGGFTAGAIVSSANGSISIKQQNGSSTEIVLLSPTTQILKQAPGSASDLTTGTEVIVTGTTNSDGSLTATSVQIRPARPQQN
jgi:hypothetical protein